jgi:acyl carrier protein
LPRDGSRNWICTQGRDNCSEQRHKYCVPAILRYNSPNFQIGQVENILTLSTDAVGVQLAKILTEYLRSNSVDTPASNKTITTATNMVSDLQLDSFQVMEFMLEVEDHYDVAIDLESLSNIQTILDLAAVVISAHND